MSKVMSINAKKKSNERLSGTTFSVREYEDLKLSFYHDSVYYIIIYCIKLKIFRSFEREHFVKTIETTLNSINIVSSVSHVPFR